MDFPDIDGVPVDMDEADDIDNVFNSSSVHATCMNILMRALFEKGFEFHIKKNVSVKTSNLDTKFEFLKQQWEPAVRLAVQEYIKFGYVVISHEICECETTGIIDTRPIVANIRQFTLHGITDPITLGQRWEARRVESYYHKDATPLHVITPSPQYCPDPYTGEHRTALAVTLSNIDYVNVLDSEYINGIRVRSTPIMIIEHNMEALKMVTDINASLRQTGMPDLRSMFGDEVITRTPLGRSEGNTHKSRDVFNQSRDALNHDKQEEARKRMHEAHGRNALRARSYALNSANTRIIPPNLKMSQTQPHIPQAQTEILRHHESLREQIVAMYGIPPSMVMFAHNAGQRQSVQVADVQETLLFMRTIKDLKSVVLTIFKQMYRHIYNLKNINEMLFDVALNTSQLAHPEQLYRAHSQGLIDGDTLQEKLLDAIGLGQEDAATKEVRIIHPPVGGTERHTTDRMKAELRATIADAKNKEAEAKRKIAETSNSGNESAVVDKQMKLEEMKIEGQLKILDKQIRLKEVELRVQAKAAKKPKTSA